VDYKYKGSILREYPADVEVLSKVEPVYKTLPGWQSSCAGVREWTGLPAKAQDYLKFLSDYLATPISIVSTGPERDETIRLA
jgi:adenylosuccinate synthase